MHVQFPKDVLTSNDRANLQATNMTMIFKILFHLS